MLIRGQTTEQRIADIAQKFGQAASSLGDTWSDAAKVKDEQNRYAEAKKRQEAVQAFELSSKIAADSGRMVSPELIKPMLKTGDFTGLGDALKASPMSPKFERDTEDRKRQGERDKKQLEVWDSQIEKNRKGPARKGETENGTRLKPAEIAKFNEGNQLPAMLDELALTVDNNKDLFGPVGGRLASLNPYDERFKTAESQITSTAQAVGKYLEGGVLRAEDVPKYRKMLPDAADTPEVAKNKLDTVRRLLINRQNSDVNALKGAGYDVESINMGLKAPEAPAVLKGSSQGATSSLRAELEQRRALKNGGV